MDAAFDMRRIGQIRKMQAITALGERARQEAVQRLFD